MAAGTRPGGTGKLGVEVDEAGARHVPGEIVLASSPVAEPPSDVEHERRQRRGKVLDKALGCDERLPRRASVPRRGAGTGHDLFSVAALGVPASALGVLAPAMLPVARVTPGAYRSRPSAIACPRCKETC